MYPSFRKEELHDPRALGFFSNCSPHTSDNRTARDRRVESWGKAHVTTRCHFPRARKNNKKTKKTPATSRRILTTSETITRGTGCFLKHQAIGRHIPDWSETSDSDSQEEAPVRGSQSPCVPQWTVTHVGRQAPVTHCFPRPHPPHPPPHSYQVL